MGKIFKKYIDYLIICCYDLGVKRKNLYEIKKGVSTDAERVRTELFRLYSWGIDGNIAEKENKHNSQ